MGLREKVALLLIAVIFQTTYIDCKPPLSTQNPFERYVGKKIKNTVDNSKLRYSANRNPNIYKAFNFPEVDFPSDKSHKEPVFFNQGSTNTGHIKTNKLYDLTLLDKYKKEAREKRKSKKPMREDHPIETLLKDQPSYILDKGMFPEIEYPLNVMDTWTPKYWSSPVDYFTSHSDFVPHNQAITKQSNSYVSSVLKKRNNEHIVTTNNKANKNEKITSVNQSNNNNSSKSNKLTVPFKSNSTLIDSNMFSTNTSNSSMGRKMRRKLRKRIKSANVLNDNKDILIDCKQTRPQSGKLLKMFQTLGSKNNNILNKTSSWNINVFSNNFTGNENVNNLTSSSNFEESDLLQLEELSSSDLRELAEQILQEIDSLPNELPTGFVIPKCKRLDNQTVHSMLPETETMIDLSLSPKYCVTSINNANKKTNSYFLPSHVANLTVLYYLVNKVIEKLVSQQNNLIGPDDNSAAIMNPDTMPTEYIDPNVLVPNKINNDAKTMITATGHVLPEILASNYDKHNHKSLITNTSLDYTSAIPDNITTTNSHPFCVVPIKDQCSMGDPPEFNFSNNSTLTLIDILTGPSCKKVSENIQYFTKENENFNKQLNKLEPLAVLEKVLGENITNNGSFHISESRNISNNYNATLNDVSELNIQENSSNVISQSTYKSLSPKYVKIANIPKSSMGTKTINNNTLIIASAGSLLKDMPINNTILDMQDSKITGKVLGYCSSSSEPNNITLGSMPECASLNILENKALEVIPALGDFLDSSKAPKNETLGVISENSSLSTIPENDSLGVKTNFIETENKTANYKLEDDQVSSENNIKDNTSTNEILNNKQTHNTLEELSNISYLSNFPKTESNIRPINDTLEEIPADFDSTYDMQTEILAYGELKDELVSNVFSAILSRDDLKEEVIYEPNINNFDMVEYNASHIMLDKKTLENMTEYQTKENVLDYTLEKITNNVPLPNMNVNNNSNTQDMLSNIYDNDIDIFYVETHNKNFGESLMSKNAKIIDTNTHSDIINLNNFLPNVTGMSSISYKNTHFYNSNDILDFPKHDTKSDLVKILDSVELPDKLDIEIAEYSNVFNTAEKILNKTNLINLPGVLDTVKLNVTDVDDLVDVLFELLIEDLTDVESGTGEVPKTFNNTVNSLTDET